ncbi:MAG: uracil-DNA glycosylase family protein [Candidatus Micrarchaeaceae archaeon]
MVKFVYDGGILLYKYAKRGNGGGDGRGRKHSKRERLFLFLKGKGHLDMPKGHIEKGETSLDAAKRETLEETGIDAVPDPYFKHTIVFWYVENGEKVKTTLAMYLAKAGEKSKVKVTEHSGYVWLSYKSAMKGNLFENEKELVRLANDYIDKKELLESINKDYEKMPERVEGWKLSRNFVPGEGPANAKVMVVGQAPGRNEDMQQRPFVGASGKLLDHLLRLAGLNRNSIYITSVVQFFPPKNRAPSTFEAMLCKTELLEQIYVINPAVIVLLGSVASRYVINVPNVMKRHGELIKGRYFITLHPAAAVRLKKNMPIIEGDFKKLKSILKSRGII